MQQFRLTNIRLACVLLSLTVAIAAAMAPKIIPAPAANLPSIDSGSSQNMSNPANSFATTPMVDAKDATVAIDNFAFTPQELSVAVGGKVTWINRDDVPHTATSKDNPAIFDSKTLDTDERYSHTFTKPGIYPYYCKVHTHMSGSIIVK